MAFAASFPFPPARPRRSWRARFRSTLLDLVTAARDRLVAWQADEYTTRGTEAVVGVIQPGASWTIHGRYGQVLVSTTLPIWDIDIDGVHDIDDETIVERIRACLDASEETRALVARIRLRVYRTHGGVRIIGTTFVFNPANERDWAWFQQLGQVLGADPIYVRMCLRQRTFRARLDPKPSRLAASGLSEARTCRLIADDLGGHADHPTSPWLLPQLQIHDIETQALHDHHLPLA